MFTFILYWLLRKRSLFGMVNTYMNTNKLFFILICILMAACAASPPPSVRYTYPNGLITSLYPEVVKIDFGKSRCSGVVVGPEVVVTAAHCIRNAHKETTFVILANGEKASVTDFARIGLRDVAFLRTSLPEGYPTIRISSNPLDLSGNLELVGFGCSPFTGDFRRTFPSGTKRIASFISTPMTTSFFVDNHGGNAPENNGKIVFRDENIRVCPGDSGGAVINKENHTLVGVLVSFLDSSDVSGVYLGTVMEELITFGIRLRGAPK